MVSWLCVVTVVNIGEKKCFHTIKGIVKKSRENSDIDWKLVFTVLDEMRSEVRDYLPYKIIHIDSAEADDVIAVLCEWTQENNLVQNGLYQDPQKNMIISSDADFLQLQKWDNVHQFSPRAKKQLTMSKRDLWEKYITHIVKAGDDGIPGILADDDTIVTPGKRTPPMSAKRLAEFIELGKAACKNEKELRNWDRNEQLISFDFIPDTVKTLIIDSYIQQNPKRDSMKLMNYLMKNKCNLLIEELGNF